MPRAQHPNSVKHRFTSENAKENGRKGGKKSGKTKVSYKTFKECFSNEMTDEDREDMFNMLMKRAKAGNLKAFEILRDTMGEKPVEHIEQSNTDIIIDFGNIEGDE